MGQVIIEQKRYIKGTLSLRGDKSISHRAIMLGAIARGKSIIKNCLRCDDCDYTVNAFKHMGIRIAQKGAFSYVFGKGLLGLKRPKEKIFLGDSGTSMRLLMGILAAQNFNSILYGNKGLLKRPMSRVIKPLSLMGARIEGKAGSGFAPLKIKGTILKPITYTSVVPSAQVKSAVLLAGLYADGKTTVRENFKSRDHTERMLRHFGARVEMKNLSCSVSGISELDATSIDVPADISSTSFFIVAALLLKGSILSIKRVGLNPTRTGFITVLKRMGARIEIEDIKLVNQEPVGDLIVKYSPLHGTIINNFEIPLCIDELPVLMVAASLSEGKTVIRGASELRVKETDRINSMVSNLRRLGARISERGDDIHIEGALRLKGAPVLSFNDHRTAMSMAVAGLVSEGKTKISGFECVSKSFPDFFVTLKGIIH